IDRIRIDLELFADRLTRAVEAARKDAARIPVLGVAVPHGDETTRRVHRDVRVVLRAERKDVDLELGADVRPVARETLAEDAFSAAVLHDALPDHDERTRRIRGDAREGLLARGRRVDLEVDADRRARRLEPAREHPVVAPVLAVARPHDDETIRAI